MTTFVTFTLGCGHAGNADGECIDKLNTQSGTQWDGFRHVSLGMGIGAGKANIW